MSEILQVDLDTLHRMGSALDAHAGAITEITVTATAQMADSPLQPLATRSVDAITQAFGAVGGGIQHLAEASTTAATSYDGLDAAFAAQLHRHGDGPR